MSQAANLGDENKRLRKLLQEAQDLIDAIRNGRIDALVVSGTGEDSIYTLKGADHTYRILIETMDEGAVILSRDESILYCNRSFAEMLQVPSHQVTGHTITEFIAAPDHEKFHTLHDQAFTTKGGKAEINLRAADADLIPALISLRALPMGEGFQTECMVVTNLTEQKEAETKLQSYSQQLSHQNAELKWRTEQLARLSSELTMAEQRERRRLADLLHDHLQQLLAGARLNLDFVSQEGASAQHPAFKDAYDLLAQSLETSRSLCDELSPPVLYMHGLAEALKWLVRWMDKTHKLQVELHVDPQAAAPQEDLKVLLFQSVRELLFNVVKHAGTSAARVELRRRNDHLRIIVSDEGAGFNTRGIWEKGRQADSGWGYGLFNIRERLLLLNGAFDIESAPAAGTTVILTAPLQPSAEDRSQSGTPIIDEQRHQAAGLEPARPGRSDGTIQVMLVDDHAVMRQGLSLMLSRHDDIAVVGEAADGGQAIEMALRMHPDIILMDISMPVMDGIEATRIIHSQMPQISIIALSMHDADDQAAAMQGAGAVAYLSKSGNPETIVATIRQHGNGGIPMCCADGLQACS